MTAGDVTNIIVKPKAYRCAVFDGVDDFLSNLDVVDYFAKGKAVSVSLWFRQDFYSTDFNTLFQSRNTDNERFVAGIGWSAVQIGYYSTADGYTRLQKTLGTGDTNWHHLVLTSTEGTDIKGYLDGVEMTTTGSAVSGASNGFKIGSRTDLVNYFKGCLTDFYIYDRVLSSDEISSLANRVMVGTPVAEWKMLDAEDSSGNDYKLTNVGVSFVVDVADVSNIMSGLRAGANDEWKIKEVNEGEVQITHIEE